MSDNPDYEGPEGSRLREEADHFANERSRLFDAATAKREAGDHHSANELVREAKEIGEKMKMKNREAAEAILYFNNGAKGHGMNYLDLHGLREEEAMEYLRERVEGLRETTKEGTVVDFEVIPGAGHHSGPGGQKLKSATERYFKSQHIEYEPINVGAFMAKIVGTAASTTQPTTTTAPPPTSTAPAKKEEKESTSCCCLM